MTILFAYDGSESADAAIAAAGQLLGDGDATADVVTVWEPLTVEALRAARFGGSPPIPPDVADVDRRAAAQAKRLASAVQDSRIFPARIRRSTERGITPSEGGTLPKATS